jgi:hypothetical protein
MRPVPGVIAASCIVLGLNLASAAAQRTDAFVESVNHPAIGYTTRPVHDVAAELDAKLEQGTARLAFDRDSGYLRSVLDALHVPVESQVLVFSQGSAQARQISVRTPRALYFNDTTAVGFARGAGDLEIAVEDVEQGVVFYTLAQSVSARPRLARDNTCLRCHLIWDTLGVPGLQMLSTFRMSDDPNAYADGLVVDDRTPMAERWGGWYVTGTAGSPHLGNVPVIVPKAQMEKPPPPTPQLTSVAGLVEAGVYPTPYSDIVALMVLAHQARMTNLITRVGWEARVAATMPAVAPGLPARVRTAARDLVDYLLFVDEAPLRAPIQGTSGFAEWFSRQGPRDAKGRSLHQLDLEHRLLRYPCSYMIDTPAFDALTPMAKEAVYGRLWDVLSGEETAPRYARLTRADRQAILEILRDTKHDLPGYFRAAAR